MSRKDKTTEKNQDKEKILDELAAGLKLEEEKDDFEKHEEESELEEDVDDSNLNLQNLEFHQFMQLSEVSQGGTPALERIAGSAPGPIFVRGISRESEAPSGADSKDESGYLPGAGGNVESKYFAEPGIENAPERLDFTRVGRTNSFREEINQERFFRQSEARIESPNIERFERVERFDTENAGRRNLFERPEAKYEKYKSKLSKA